MTIHEVIDDAAKLNKILSDLNSQRTADLEIEIDISRYCSRFGGNFRSFDELKTLIKEKDFSKDVESTILDNIEKLDFNFGELDYDEICRYASTAALRTKSNQEVKLSIYLTI